MLIPHSYVAYIARNPMFLFCPGNKALLGLKKHWGRAWLLLLHELCSYFFIKWIGWTLLFFNEIGKVMLCVRAELGIIQKEAEISWKCPKQSVTQIMEPPF